jgi:hypothetical protein
LRAAGHAEAAEQQEYCFGKCIIIVHINVVLINMNTVYATRLLAASRRDASLGRNAIPQHTLHPVGDASLTGCVIYPGDTFSTERSNPDGL